MVRSSRRCGRPMHRCRRKKRSGASSKRGISRRADAAPAHSLDGRKNLPAGSSPFAGARDRGAGAPNRRKLRLSAMRPSHSYQDREKTPGASGLVRCRRRELAANVPDGRRHWLAHPRHNTGCRLARSRTSPARRGVRNTERSRQPARACIRTFECRES